MHNYVCRLCGHEFDTVLETHTCQSCTSRDLEFRNPTSLISWNDSFTLYNKATLADGGRTYQAESEIYQHNKEVYNHAIKDS